MKTFSLSIKTTSGTWMMKLQGTSPVECITRAMKVYGANDTSIRIAITEL